MTETEIAKRLLLKRTCDTCSYNMSFMFDDESTWCGESGDDVPEENTCDEWVGV